jgi:hypothetical protein
MPIGIDPAVERISGARAPEIPTSARYRWTPVTAIEPTLLV